MDLYETLHEILNNALASKTFPGYAAALVTPDAIKTITGGTLTYGETSSKIEPTTLYDVASLTKIIGPMSVAMKLIDSGKLQMSDTIGKYIPEFNTDEQKATATIRHLLTYTLEYDIPFGVKFLIGELTPDELRLRMFRLPLKTPPGSTYLYSNITAFILTQLIERATGSNFYTLVTKEITTPLHMKTATFSPERSSWSSIPPTEITSARGTIQGFVHDESSHHLNTGNISSGAAGLFASVDDVARFLQMVISNETTSHPFFSTLMRDLWVTNQFPDLLPKPTPLGWGDTNNEMIEKYPGRFVVKGGFTGCFMIGDVKNNIGIVVLSNLTYPIRPKERPGFTRLKEDIVKLLINN